MKIREEWRSRLIAQWPWVVAGILLCWPAIYNGFPLVYSDSGTYINSSFDLLPPADRSVGYGYFIHIVTWKASLWPVIFFQGWLVAGLIWQSFRLILPEAKTFIFLSLMLVLGIFSSLSWYVSQLMPDIFVGVLILSLANLIWQKNSRILQIWNSILVFLACAVHTSHIMLALLILVLMVFIFVLRQPFKKVIVKTSLLFVPVLVAILFIMGNQAANGHGFRLSRTSNLFLTGRLADAHLLQPFLYKECHTQKFPLCDYEMILPITLDEVLWDQKYSLPVQFGGWEKADSAVAPMVSYYFSKTKNKLDFAKAGLINGWKQLGRFQIGDGMTAQGWEDAPTVAIRWRIPRHIQAFINARQQTGNLNIHFFQLLQKPIFYVCTFFMAIFSLFLVQRMPEKAAFLGFLILGLILHAFVMGTFAVALDRYQARISWLIPLAALLVILITRKKHLIPKSSGKD